ncbi:hypothetical protein [Rhizobium sp. L1K21]|uniref:hypothetical protein n=1 Tax=Rhizobium sp. L1K21 TaxID=2954933 RepID=UPI0020933743|nr:hypothetical protein [Rhizobium sp. L1K21]MCO6185611.1 hypothetical protein [Rhizobium sp. L1K21]
MMLSVDTGLSSQSAALSQTPSSPLGPAKQDEDKKKQSHIPTVEVSAAQAQGFSPRVGDFLANQTSKSSSASSGTSAVSPTGADGSAPATSVSTATPPPQESENDGSSTGGRSDQAAMALSLLKNEAAEAPLPGGDGDIRFDEEPREEEVDGDDLTYTASQQPARSPLEDIPPVPPANAGTIVNTNQAVLAQSEGEDQEPEFSDEQRGGDNRESVEETGEAKESAKRDQKPDQTPSTTAVKSGDFSLYFDEAGTYQMAAA